ncbi:unnamed protein product, partial [Iphiclides podalirius]
MGMRPSDKPVESEPASQRSSEPTGSRSSEPAHQNRKRWQMRAVLERPGCSAVGNCGPGVEAPAAADRARATLDSGPSVRQRVTAGRA